MVSEGHQAVHEHSGILDKVMCFAMIVCVLYAETALAEQAAALAIQENRSGDGDSARTCRTAKSQCAPADLIAFAGSSSWPIGPSKMGLGGH